jgi:hypothetical protein
VSLANQTHSLAAQGASWRKEAFGSDQVGRMEDTDGALPFACYFSADKSGELSFALGFKETHDFILRVSKDENNFVPEIGKHVRLIAANGEEDVVVRLEQKASSNINPEFVFGCKADF